MFSQAKAKMATRRYQEFETEAESVTVSVDAGRDAAAVEETHFFRVEEDGAIIARQTIDVCKGSFHNLAMGAYLELEDADLSDEFLLPCGNVPTFPQRMALSGIPSPGILIFRPKLKKGIVMLLQNGGGLSCYLECTKSEAGAPQVGCVCAKTGESPIRQRVEASFRAYMIDAGSMQEVKDLYEEKKNQDVLLDDDLFDVFDSGSRIQIGLLGG